MRNTVVTERPCGRGCSGRVDVLECVREQSCRPLANATLKNSLFRKLLEQVAGVAAERPLPAYAAQRFDVWFRKHKKAEQSKG